MITSRFMVFIFVLSLTGCSNDSNKSPVSSNVNTSPKYGSITVSGSINGNYEFDNAVVYGDTQNETTSIGLSDNTGPITVILGLSGNKPGIYQRGGTLQNFQVLPYPMAVVAKTRIGEEHIVFYSIIPENASGIVTIITFDEKVIEGEFSGTLISEEGKEITVTGDFSVPLEHLLS